MSTDGAHAPAPFRDEADFLGVANRWARLLFQRLRVAGGTARRPEEQEPSPSAALFAGARPVQHTLTPAIEQLRDELSARMALPMADGRGCPAAQLQHAFSLSARELDVLLVLAAYELDARLHRAYAELVGGAPGARLSIGAVADLVAPRMQDKLEVLGCLGLNGTLRCMRLLQVGPADQGPGDSGRSVEAHPRIIATLAGDRALDDPLHASASLGAAFAPLEELPYSDDLKQTVVRAWRWASAGQTPRRVLLEGTDPAGKQALLGGLAAAFSRPLLTVDLGAVVALYDDAEVALQDHVRESVLAEAILYIDAHDCPAIPPATSYRLAAALSSVRRFVAVGFRTASPLPFPLHGQLLRVPVPVPDAAGREVLWRRALAQAECPLPDGTVLADLARRYTLGFGAIVAAAHEAGAAAATASRREARRPDFNALAQAARRHQTHTLGKWAIRVESNKRWEDLIAPPQTLEALRDIVRYVYHSDQVFARWEFGRKLGYGTGLSVLFFGPPGTGKTMAGSLIAGALERELFRIDLSRITSQWIGETEKNLGELFEQARASEAVLLFDEADSLFARRTAVRTSTDRYANLGVNYLLQKLEEFAGVTILTTNQPDAIDDAFKRRLRFQVEFPVPDIEQRETLWRVMLPPACDIGDDIRFDRLARYELSPSHIQNAILRSAFMAAEKGRSIGMDMMIAAADEEYRSLGKLVRARADASDP